MYTQQNHYHNHHLQASVARTLMHGNFPYSLSPMWFWGMSPKN